MNTDKVNSAVIVKMQVADINSVREILVENNLETWNYNDFLSEIHRLDSLVLVGKIKNKVIGFCVARLIKPEGNMVTDIKSKDTNKVNYSNTSLEVIFHKPKELFSEGNFEVECEIYNIAVKKECQNQGFGKQILDEIVFLTKGHNVRSIWLEVRNSNLKAIDFYKKNNFRQEYERKNFYSNPLENALVMKLKVFK